MSNVDRRFESHSRLLYKIKRGTVTAEVHGPRIGWRWRRIKYYRWQKSTRDPKGWDQVSPNRPGDLLHLEQCVKAVRAWLRQEEHDLERIHRSPVSRKRL